MHRRGHRHAAVQPQIHDALGPAQPRPGAVQQRQERGLVQRGGQAGAAETNPSSAWVTVSPKRGRAGRATAAACPGDRPVRIEGVQFREGDGPWRAGRISA
ncbi:MAG: hypothetical protein ACLSHC_04695 [Bilophila wadsworthia]